MAPLNNSDVYFVLCGSVLNSAVLCGVSHSHMHVLKHKCEIEDSEIAKWIAARYLDLQNSKKKRSDTEWWYDSRSVGVKR